MAQYELKNPIYYRSLSGFHLNYDLIIIERTKNGNIQITMSESTGLPRSLEPVITVDHIDCSEGTVALKQSSPCIQIAEELIQQGVLIRDEKNRTIHSRFVDYDLYKLDYEVIIDSKSAAYQKAV